MPLPLLRLPPQGLRCCFVFHQRAFTVASANLILFSITGAARVKARNDVGLRQESSIPVDGPDTNINSSAQTFTFRELAAATKNFRDECFIGEGGFGRVYRGQLETGQIASPILLYR